MKSIEKKNINSFRGSSITNGSLVSEDLLRMLVQVIDRTQFGRCLTVRLNLPSIEEIKTWRRPWTTVFVQFKLYFHIVLTTK